MNSSELLDRTRNAIRVQLREGTPSMREVAEAMQLGQRTLGRRLDASGTSFKHLLDEVRYGMASQFMERGYPLEEISNQLGFSDPPCFYRAFKRWTGCSPREYSVYLTPCIPPLQDVLPRINPMTQRG